MVLINLNFPNLVQLNMRVKIEPPPIKPYSKKNEPSKK